MIKALPALTINYFPERCVISMNNIGLSLHPIARMETSQQEHVHMVVTENEERDTILGLVWSRIVAKSFKNPSERLRIARRADLANNEVS